MRNKFLFFVLLIGLTVKAQTIPVKQIAPPVETTYLYDSLTQQTDYKDCKKLIGQVIYGPTKSSICIEYYNRQIKTPAEMEGKYFTVTDAVKEDIYGMRVPGVNLKLKELKTGKTTSYSLPNGENYDIKTLDPLIIMGYMDKLKAINVGRKFIALKKVDYLIDMRTGDFTNYSIGSTWVCTDVKLLATKYNYYLVPRYIFKDSTGTEVAINLKFGANYISDHTENYADNIFVDVEKYIAKQKEKQQQEIQKQLEKALAEQQAAEAEQARVTNLIKKYGKNFGTKVANGEVAIGMTKNMCKDAWGEPLRIHETKVAKGTTEKWFYTYGRFLFFTGNTLSSLQH